MAGCNCNKESYKRKKYNHRNTHTRKSKSNYRPKHRNYYPSSKSKSNYRPTHRNYKDDYSSRKSLNNKINQYYVKYQKDEYNDLNGKDLRSWDRIHKMAVEANTPKLKTEFEKYMRYLAYNFPCPKCRPHIKKRLITNPIRNYYNMKDKNGRYIGLAKWSWEFHNAVNKRLGKSTVTWDDFTAKYLN
jgi:hypothetical protein